MHNAAARLLDPTDALDAAIPLDALDEAAELGLDGEIADEIVGLDGLPALDDAVDGVLEDEDAGEEIVAADDAADVPYVSAFDDERVPTPRTRGPKFQSSRKPEIVWVRTKPDDEMIADWLASHTPTQLPAASAVVVVAEQVPPVLALESESV